MLYCSRAITLLLCVLGVLCGSFPALIKKTAEDAEDAEGRFAANTRIRHYRVEMHQRLFVIRHNRANRKQHVDEKQNNTQVDKHDRTRGYARG